MTSTTTTLRRTILNAVQKAAGGRMVDFHGWELPVQFSSILQEHHAVRKACGLFDVSHMGQIEVTGTASLDFLQKVNANDASRLKNGDALYSHLLNDRAGVIDDVIFSKLEDQRWFMVVNASTVDKDFAWLQSQAAGMDVRLKNLSDHFSMIAIQGPLAEKILSSLEPKAAALKRFGALELEFDAGAGLITRTGYTGEDGFELIMPNASATRVWETLAANGASYGLLPCGLGSRDTLRLEAGYLLYGSDVDEDHTTLEANYGWVVKFNKASFNGKAVLERQKREGLRRKLLGVRLEERGVPRPGARVLLGTELLGTLCSATFSPTLQAGIGVGYLSKPDLAAGTQVVVESQGRCFAAKIAQMPFYKR